MTVIALHRPPASVGARPPVPGGGGKLSEVFAVRPADGGAAGFVLVRLAGREKPVLWAQDRLSRKESGAPYLTGLSGPILRADLSAARDVLIAMEEGLRRPGLAGVVGEIWGDPPVLDFTASRRLAMRAEASGVPCWLIRRAAPAGLSAARDRWRVGSLPSAPHPDDPAAPGDPRWRVELFRSRSAPPGVWIARHDRAADRLDFTPASGDGALVEDDGARGRGAAG